MNDLLKVYCIWCEEHIYNLNIKPTNSLQLLSSQFIPANENIPQPKPHDNIECPLCKLNFLVNDGFGGYQVMTNKGLLP